MGGRTGPCGIAVWSPASLHSLAANPNRPVLLYRRRPGARSVPSSSPPLAGSARRRPSARRGSGSGLVGGCWFRPSGPPQRAREHGCGAAQSFLRRARHAHLSGWQGRGGGGEYFLPRRHCCAFVGCGVSAGWAVPVYRRWARCTPNGRQHDGHWAPDQLRRSARRPSTARAVSVLVRLSCFPRVLSCAQKSDGQSSTRRTGHTRG